MYFQTQVTQWERSLERKSKQSSLKRNHTPVDLHENLAGYDVATHQLRIEA